MRFIHIAQIEILILPVYVNDLKNDDCISIPNVLEIY